jgi:hypothetical protein
MFVPGKIETYCFVIDLGGNSLALPLSSFKMMVKKLMDVYTMRLDKMFIINVNYALKVTYNAFKIFIS